MRSVEGIELSGDEVGPHSCECSPIAPVKGFTALRTYRKLITKTDTGEKLDEKERCSDAKLLTARVFVKRERRKKGMNASPVEGNREHLGRLLSAGADVDQSHEANHLLSHHHLR